jgi:Cu2+-exporting ATPase
MGHEAQGSMADHGHHGDHHRHMIRDFRRRFWNSLGLTIPVLALSPLIQSVLGFRLAFWGDRDLLFGLAAAIYFYGGWPFLKGFAAEARRKQPGMMTLIALAVSVAFGYSAVVTFGVPGKVFFWELATLIDVMLLGHWIEMRSILGASRALEELARLMPTEAHRIEEGGRISDIGLSEVHKGDRLLVRPGEKIPADGIVIDGASEVNQAMLTGESKPVERGKGDNVIGGAVNGTGALSVEVRGTGSDSFLARVVDLVRSASESKSRAQAFADRAAFWLTVVALSVGGVTLAVWLVSGRDFAFALERMVTVMVITCPHALGLAVPLVIAVVTSLSARNGLLIRNRTAFEVARLVDTVVFDKTGTLTRGEFGVTDVIPTGDWGETEILRRAASVETNSEHSIARGIVRKAEREDIKLTRAERFEALPGKGARSLIDGELVFVGNRGVLGEAGVSSEQAEETMKRLSSQGKTVVFVAARGKVMGIIGLADIVRDESRRAVAGLKAMGLEVAMITGDNEPTARAVASDLGIDVHFSEVLPTEKSEKISELQKKGKKVAMVGDGVNDAPALAQADVGIAIGAGTDIAAETADVILVENNPENVADVVRLSRVTRRKMTQNLAWATAYNVIAIPLAAGVLERWGILLAPAMGALVMSVSTVIVAINARLVSYKRAA